MANPTKAQLAAAFKIEFNQIQNANLFGVGLWEVINTVGTAMVARTLKEDEDLGKLPKGLYQQTGQYGEQLILKPEGQGWFYVSINRDADGEPIMSESGEYEIREVRLRRDFKIPGSDVVLPAGRIALKAYEA